MHKVKEDHLNVLPVTVESFKKLPKKNQWEFFKALGEAENITQERKDYLRNAYFEKEK